MTEPAATADGARPEPFRARHTAVRTRGDAPGDVWVHYLRALVRIEVDGRILEVRLAGPGQAGRVEVCSGPWPFAAPVTVLTAWNPGSEPRGTDANMTAQRSLEAELRAAGLPTLPAEGRSPEGDWSEASVAVPGLGLDVATTIGRRYGQRALYWLHAAGGAVVGCRDAPRRVDRPWRTRWAAAPAQRTVTGTR